MNQTDLSQYNNAWYQPGGSALKRLLWYFVNVIFFKNGWNPLSGLKVRLLRLFGSRVGVGVMIKPGVNIKYPWWLEIEDHCWIGEDVWIDCLTTVKLGKHVCLSQGAMLLTGNHNYKSHRFDLIVQSIVLEEGVWIGAKAIVGPGVIARSHSILTVGSVANRGMEAYWIYQGNPAVAVRERKMEK